MFVLSIVGIVWLNLPRVELPPQDMTLLWRDRWFLYAFVYFSFLIIPVALMMVADAYRRATRWGWLTPLYMALGIVPLSLYLAVRPVDANMTEPRWVRTAYKRRWFWVFSAAATVIAAFALLPFGTLQQFVETLRHNFGWWFMPVDILLNHFFCLPIVHADMEHRHAPNQFKWLTLIALTGPIGLNLYLARTDV
jgi:hypothetical protein